jgi:hypothetical protein
MGGDSTGDTGAVDDGSGNDPLAKRHARVAADGSTDSTDPTIDDGSTDPTIDDGSTDPTIDDGTTDPTTDGSGDTSTGAGTDACTAALKVGAVVTEASFSVTADGTFFDAIELK